MTDRKETTKKAVKKKSAKTTKPGAKHVRTEQIRLVVGFVFLAISIYLFFAFGSFLFNAGADQSKLQIDWWKLVKDSGIKVENITGKTGAWLADVFINRWFGYSSFFFIYLLVLYGAQLLNLKVKSLLSKTIKTLLLILWLSITLGFVFGSKYGTMNSYPGGSYGYHIALWLNSLVGKIGTFFVLLVSLLTYLVFAFENFVHLFKKSKSPKKDPEGELLNNNEITPKSDKKAEKVTLIDLDDTPDPVDESEDIADGYTEPNTFQDIETDDENSSDEVSTKTIIGDEDEDGLEMTVEKKEELVGEYENQPLEDYDPTLDLSHYQYPSIDLLDDYSHLKSEVSDEELIENKNKIVETLRNFKIEITKIKATIVMTIENHCD